MRKAVRNTIIVVGIFIIVVGALIALVLYPRARTLQDVREAVNKCDDIAFVMKPRQGAVRAVDVDGLNAESLETRRQVILAMLDNVSGVGKMGESKVTVNVKKNGQAILVIDMHINGFAVKGKFFEVNFEGNKTLKRLFCYRTLEHNRNHGEILDAARTILATCDSIEFWIKRLTYLGVQGLIDVQELNAEPLEMKRQMIAELFSSAVPSTERVYARAPLTGEVILKKEGKIVLIIILDHAGFGMRLHDFEVPSSVCEGSETLQRLLCPEKISGESS